MSRQLQKIYAPQTIPCPWRSRRWSPDFLLKKERKRYSRHLDLVRYFIPAPKPELAGKKLLFLSDVHFRNTPESRQLLGELKPLLEKLEFDRLLSGGDFCADADQLVWQSELLSTLRKTRKKSAKEPLAVLGNWERGKKWIGVEKFRKLYQDNGFKLLVNEWVEDEDFIFYGCDELNCGYPLPPPETGGRYGILLAHQPDTVIALDHNEDLKNFSLNLCGHTHGGQLRLPGLGPLFSPSRYGRKFNRGAFRSGDGRHLIISAGLGECSFRWRLFCRREAVIIEFC